MEIFEKAVRLKVRFLSRRGPLTVEDLWDLPLTELDAIYKQMNVKAKAAKEESLLEVRSDEDRLTDLTISIVKHIVTVRLEEQEQRKTAAANKAKKDKILEILAKKQDASLESMSEEDLKKMVESL